MVRQNYPLTRWLRVHVMSRAIKFQVQEPRKTEPFSKAKFLTFGEEGDAIAVISDKYLESPNCMFELVEIAKNGKFYDRIFPIVLADAEIYKPIARLKYIKHWEEQIKELDEGMKEVGAANLQGFRE